MTEPSELPIRFISRRMTWLGLAGARILLRGPGGDMQGLVIFTAIILANVAHHPYASEAARITAEGSDRPQDGLRRPVSISALARSLEMPGETVRRRVASFVERGLCVRVADGVVVPAEVIAGPVVREPWLEVRAAVLEAFENIRSAGVDLEAVAAQAPATGPEPSEPLSDLVEARIALDATMRAFERWRDSFGGYVGNYLICAVLDANTGYLDQPPLDPLEYGYFDRPPPDELRRPIRVAALARRTGLPPATVRRWVETLVADDWLEVVPGPKGGLIVPTRALVSPRFLDITNGVIVNGLRLLAELHRLGRRIPAS